MNPIRHQSARELEKVERQLAELAKEGVGAPERKALLEQRRDSLRARLERPELRQGPTAPASDEPAPEEPKRKRKAA